MKPPCLLPALLLVVPSLASARITDVSDHWLNVSAAQDSETERWIDEYAKVATGQGVVHVLWSAVRSDYGARRVMYARSGDHGATFDPPVILAGDAGGPRVDGSMSALAVDGNLVHAVYYGDWPVTAWYRRSVDGGLTFGDPQALHTAYNHDTRLHVKAANGVVVIAFTLNMQDAPYSKELAVKVSTNGGATLSGTTIMSSAAIWRVGVEDLLLAGTDVHVLYSVVDENWFSSAGRLFVASSQDTGQTFLPAVKVTDPAANTLDYAPQVQADNYSPNLAACAGSVVVTWMNPDDLGGFDGWADSSLRVRRSTDRGATWGASTVLHDFPAGYGNGSHAGLETVVCKGNRAVVATVLNDGGGEAAHYWVSDDGGGSWGAGQVLGPGGWWPQVHFTPGDAAGGTFHLFHGWHGVVVSPGDVEHGFTHVIPSAAWAWNSPSVAVDADNVFHVVAHGGTIFGDAGSGDVSYRRLVPPPAPSGDQAMALQHEPGDGRRDSMRVGATTLLPGSGAFTVEFWVKPTLVPNTGYQFLKKFFSTMDTGSYATGGTLEVNAFPWQGELLIQGGVRTTPYTYVWGPAWPQGRWCHLAMSYDPEASADALRVYLDGLLVVSGGTGGSVEVDKLGLVLGDDGYYNAGSALFDDVMVWSQVRAPEDIAVDMVQGATGNEPALVAYWPLDGTTLDVTGHGHDGVLLCKESFLPGDCPHNPPASLDGGVPVDGGAVGTDGGSTGDAAHGGDGGAATGDAGAPGGDAGAPGSDGGAPGSDAGAPGSDAGGGTTPPAEEPELCTASAVTTTDLPGGGLLLVALAFLSLRRPRWHNRKASP